MTTHFYLSLLPEALIVSMLDPEDFGTYYAVGSAKNLAGEAMFYEVDPTFRHPYFRIDEALQALCAHEDGSPKASIYVSVYRVLEHIRYRCAPGSLSHDPRWTNIMDLKSAAELANPRKMACTSIKRLSQFRL